MSKFESFVVKHDKAVLNSVTMIFVTLMFASAFIDTVSVAAVFGLLVGYVVVAGVILLIASADIRRERRNRKIATTV
jgi:hypothetical protein